MKPSVTSLEKRWFFIIVSVAALFIFWKMLEPLALTLVTAFTAAIVLSPLEYSLRKLLKGKKHLSVFLTILCFSIVVLLPLFGLGILLVQEARQFLEIPLSDQQWIQRFDAHVLPLLSSLLPEAIYQQILSIDFSTLSKQAAEWAAQNLGGLFSKGANFSFQVSSFVIALYYILIDRTKIHKLALELSPFQDTLDERIVQRIEHTVRSVMVGAIIIAITQGILATVGLTIFGVPGALLWGALAVIAAQIPIVGIALIMLPAIAFLLLNGDTGNAIGLTVWAVVVVGFVDNILSPLVVGSRTKMNELLILVSILGGLHLFGPIGFIIGPTVLAGIIVLVELYRNGILEGEPVAEIAPRPEKVKRTLKKETKSKKK